MRMEEPVELALGPEGRGEREGPVNERRCWLNLCPSLR